MAMSVTVRPYRRGGWEVDITIRLPNGTRWRERSKAPVSSRTAALRWGEDRERHVLQHGLPQPKKEVPTLEEFAPRFLDGHARANRQKPSGIVSKESILHQHLIPLLGSKKLDAIATEHVQNLKRGLHDRAPKTVNNVLTVLNVLLKKAVEWNVIEVDVAPFERHDLATTQPGVAAQEHDHESFGRLNQPLVLVEIVDDRVPCVIRLLPIPKPSAGQKRQLCVQRSDWKGHVTVPKGGRLRYVPLTVRLASALREHRHLRSDRVLCLPDGSPMSADIVKHHVERAARRAHIGQSGVHRLRHTFCSHLAMRGAPARAIQELAGHQDLGTTQRYMHLSPAAIEGAIRLLEMPGPAEAGPHEENSRGDILETADA
jgi:integrase